MSLLVILGVGAAALVGVSYVLQQLKHRVLYLPTPLAPNSSPMAELPSESESIILPTVGGARIWLVTRYTSSKVPLIVFSHGNCSNLTAHTSWLRAYPNVAIYDYRGYGLSSGTCDEHTNCWDLVAVVRYLQARYSLRDPRTDIVLMGRSLGTNVALSYLEYCINYNAAAMPERTVLVHPFLSISAVLTSAPRLLCQMVGNMDRCEPLRSYLSGERHRVLVFVSARDQITPPQAMHDFAATLEPDQRARLTIVDIGGDHNCINSQLLWQRIKAFIYSDSAAASGVESGVAGHDPQRVGGSDEVAVAH